MSVLKTYSLTQEAAKLVDLLSEERNITKSQLIRNLVEKEIPMASKQLQLTKADDIVAKFFSGIPTTPDTSWLTARNAAGELLEKRAALKHCTTADPSKTEVAIAVAEEAKNPDATTRALYKIQAVQSEAHFAALKTVLSGGGQ